MTCKYCHFPTCFCGETEAVRGLGRKKTVVGSDSMWFHWNSLEKDENFRKSHLFDAFPHGLLALARFLIWFRRLPRSWLESGWTAAVWLQSDCIFWGILEIHQENLGSFKLYQTTTVTVRNHYINLYFLYFFPRPWLEDCCRLDFFRLFRTSLKNCKMDRPSAPDSTQKR